MHTNLLRKALSFGLIAAVTALGAAPAAWGDDDRRDHKRDRRDERWDDRRDAHQRWEERRERERHEQWRRAADRHEWERRRELERHRAAAHWRFERDRGWRFEHRPGSWSPFHVWRLIDGRPFLRPYPTVRIVRYPTGYYELVGNGITEPYYWVWRPTVVVSAPPPVPLPPPLSPDYSLPPDAAYPPAPPAPSG